ncbi:MAG TPA: hypothetical protein P5117_08620 [Spirochaetia bacterium]|nr:hypothetical protein [Spirochaetales bacterium]HRY81931.1 hypothetical protein [Spirochaetia bacterium]HRZ89530.1 hypothetical protein [Spirochaetia bacterium]
MRGSVGRAVLARIPPRILALALLACSVPGFGAETFRFSADRMESVIAEGRERALLSGNARLAADDLTITADVIELSGKDWRWARCSGRVSASDETQGIRLTTEVLVYDRQTRISRLEGDSVLEDSRNRVVLKAYWMEHDDERKTVTARVGVRVFKDSTSARAASLTYRRDEQSLELSGSARVLRDGDEYRAERIVMDLETDEIVLSGGVSGTVIKKKKPEEANPGETSP